MQSLGKMNKSRASRPYWVLLALALFFAGQIAIASHWHNDSVVLDTDCALCALSSATSAAITPDALIIASIPLVTFVFIEITRAFVSQRVVAYQSRAPPQHS